jgi:hypothetical protein
MSLKIKNTKAYMESYSSKLIDLLRREMASPQASRMQYENPAINATGESSGDISLRVNSSALSELSIDIKGDKHLLDIDQGTKSTIASVTDIAKWIVAKPVNYRGATQNQSLQSLGVGSPKVLSLAKKIVKSLETKGIRPTNFISRTVEKHMENLKIVAPIVEDVKENVQELLTQAGFDLKGETIKFK